MEHSREREEDRATSVRQPEPAPPETAHEGSLGWASAIGNQAVARLARQAMEPEASEAETESEAEDAPPPEVEQLEAQGIGMDAMAALASVDDMAEGDLPE